ncbi:DNA primase [compost metagenome]
MGELVGFAGFNPLSKKISRDNLAFGTDNEVPPKYIYSNKSCFDRGRYLYVPNGYRNLISSKVAILTDGIFDSITPGSLGYSTVCNLGSIVNDYTLYILSFIPRLYVAYDNDEAGISLYEYLKKKLPNVQSITQSKTKDLDDYIRKYGTSKFTEEIDRASRNRIFSSILL